MTKTWLEHPLVRKGIVEIFLCKYNTDFNHNQSLHAKGIAIKKGNKYLFAYGSANFTLPALFKDADRGNLELMFLIKELSHREFDPEKLFNPIDDAVRLEKEEQLQTSIEEEQQPATERHEIMLFEASLLGKKIDIRTQIPEKINYDNALAKITFQDNKSRSFKLTKIDQEKYSFEVSDDVLQFLSKESSLLQIELYKDNEMVGDSNSTLIVNLLDIQTGQNIRRQRHIKEAQQGANQFFQVLGELGNEDDNEALKMFLQYCDIPLIEVAIPLFDRAIRPIADADKGMRHLGLKNLSYFVELHELVIYFVDRHLRKLNRHIEFGGLDGMFNFFHIFLAIGAVLYTQIERALQGLELKEDPLTAEEWFSYRKQFDLYFIKFDELTYCLSQYITRVLEDYKLKEVQERFTPNHQAVEEFYAKVLLIKTRIDNLCETKVRIITPDNRILSPLYNKHNIFTSENWNRFEDTIKASLSNLQNMLKDGVAGQKSIAKRKQ